MNNTKPSEKYEDFPMRICPDCGKEMEVNANEYDYFYECKCGCLMESDGSRVGDDFRQ